MNDNLLSTLSAKVKNLFQSATLKSRKDDGTVRVKTDAGREIDAAEAFPYGFIAKAQSGKVSILCSGGSLDGVRVYPVESSDLAPKIDDGDAAIYTAGGTAVICHNDGTIEITNGNLNITQLMLDLTDVIISLKTSGPPPSHTITPDTVSQLKKWQEQWKKLFKVAS